MDANSGSFVISGSLGTVGAVIAWALRQKDAAQEEKLKHLADRCEKAEAAVHAAFVVIDRLKEDRMQFWTRSDHAAWETMIRQDNAALRAEIKADMKELGIQLLGRLDSAVNTFRSSIEPIVRKCLSCKGGE